MDFIKIYDEKCKNSDGCPKLIGILNINNMIPVDSSVVTKFDLKLHGNDAVPVKKRKELIQNQLRWCRKNSVTIQNRANKVYRLVTQLPEKNRNLTRRCCDFKKLEKILDKYLESGRN